MNAIGRTIQKLENVQLSFWQTMLLAYIAVFFRTFFENYSNSFNQNHLNGLIDTFFHYPYWFLIVFLSLIIILNLLTKENIIKITRIITFFFFLILIPPFIDFVINRGSTVPYGFIVGTYKQLIKQYFSFMPMAPIGVRIEIFLAILLVVIYIFYKSRNKKYAVLGGIILYSTIFIIASFPVYLMTAYGMIGNNQEINTHNISDFYLVQEPNNSITTQRTFVFDKNESNNAAIQNIKNQYYSLTLAVPFLIINILLLAWIYFIYSKEKFLTILKNIRFLRIIHYFSMLFAGIILAYLKFGQKPINSLFDVLSYFSLFLSFLFAWLFAVWENDQIDKKIDEISNQKRPLLKNIFTDKEWISIKYFFLFLSLNFAFLAGFYSFIFILLYLAIAHIYSSPPLRLKRFLGISSLLIATAALITVLAGFFMAAGTENLRAFPTKYALGILLIFCLAENIKNIKDREGDEKDGIKTLPVILGEKNGKLLIGALIFIAALLAPFFFYLSVLSYFTALFFGAILFLLTIRQKFKEEYIFITYFIYLAVFVLEILLTK